MFAEVVVDVMADSLDKIFDYQCPENIEIKEGHRVLVPFGKRKLEGYVLKLKDSTDYDENLVNTQKRDLKKNAYCLQNGISLYRIPYTEFKNIENILNKILKEKSSTTIERYLVTE